MNTDYADEFQVLNKLESWKEHDLVMMMTVGQNNVSWRLVLWHS